MNQILSSVKINTTMKKGGLMTKSAKIHFAVLYIALTISFLKCYIESNQFETRMKSIDIQQVENFTKAFKKAETAEKIASNAGSKLIEIMRDSNEYIRSGQKVKVADCEVFSNGDKICRFRKEF